jgi:[glutamine synthetase] adenylyltransferase / [glutamine synthetase]-adenylyl-L-tyrosine phosphorylase
MQRIVAAPQLCAPHQADARISGWLAEIVGAPAGKTIERLLDEHPTVGALIAGLADGSPYLWQLTRAEPQRLVALLESEPERRFDELLGETARRVDATDDEAEVMRLLRRMRSEAALLIALADIGVVWPVMEVTRRQTALADAALAAAVDYLLADAQGRGRIALAEAARPSQGSGLIVLAMGKMGSNELNYSSDIDLIVFYEADAARLAAGTEPGPFFVRLTRTLVKLLQQRTVDGYVFRTDLRLRPDPASTQIAISTAAALDYYESRGQNW